MSISVSGMKRLARPMWSWMLPAAVAVTAGMLFVAWWGISSPHWDSRLGGSIALAGWAAFGWLIWLQRAARPAADTAAIPFRVESSSRLEQLRAVVENSADAIAVIDETGRIALANERMERMFGYARIELLHHPIEKVLPAGARSNHALYPAAHPDAARKGQSIELNGLHSNGAEFPVTVSLSPVHTGQGEWMVGAIRDMSMQRHLENQLQQSEAQFKAMLESAPEAMLVVDRRGSILLANPRAEALFGYSWEELLGGSLPALVRLSEPAEGESGMRKLFDRAGMAGAGVDLDALRKDGSLFPAEVRLRPVESSSGDLKVCVAISDLTEMKRLEAEGRVRPAVQGVIEYAIVMLDDGGRVTSWNAGAEAILGYTAEEIVGRDHSVFYPERQQGECEGRMVRKDGTEFRAHCAMTPVAGGSCMIAREVTGRKAVEEQLQKAMERAEAANRAKSDFLAVISHEIRTPMNAILGMADLLHDSSLNADQRKYVEVFRRAGNNLLGLINDLLDFSKIESGHFELDRIEFDLLDVAEQSVELSAQRARSKGIDLDVHLPEAATAFRGDPARLRQVLLNLLGNAIKFTDSGKVTLTIAQAASGRAGHFDFSVADTGIGIPAGKLATIFDEFTQADNTIARKYGGTGLGLSISRRIVGLMGGELTVTSEEGKGSIFRFDVQLEPAPGVDSAKVVEAGELKGLRMMIVDHDPSNRVLLRQALAGWGVETDEFASAGEALVSLGAGHYSMAFLHGQMRAPDGGDLADQIREAAPQLPVIMVETDRRSAENAVRRPSDGPRYALRPLRRGELLQLIRKALAAPTPAGEWIPMPAAPDAATARAGRSQNGVSAKGGLRILIAEDSDDNRLLMEFYLRETPHQISLAEDGREAVDLFTSGKFDIVLMDLQMPVMDGLTATRRIRNLESDRQLEPTPILAFTANAGGPDMLRSLVAGCNAHITKPISKPALLAALEQYGVTAAVEDSRPSGESTELKALVPNYVAARQRDLERIATLIESRNFGEIRKLVHDVKGTGKAYGFPRLTKLASAMQASAETSDPAALERQFAEMADYLWRKSAC